MQNVIQLIIVIAIIAGIISSVREAIAGKAKPKVPPPDGSRSRAQAEIAAFLSGKPAAPPQPAAREMDSLPRTLVAQPVNRMSQQPEQRQGGQKSRKQKSAAQAAAKQKPANRQPAGRNPGTGVREHVESYIGDHVKSHMNRQVDDHVRRDIEDRVRSTFGADMNESQDRAAKSESQGSGVPLIQQLRSPEGLRQAILVTEILSRPRSLRR